MTELGIVKKKKKLVNRDYRPLPYEEAATRDLTETENIRKCEPIANADYYIVNNGSIEEFYERVDEVLNEIYK